MSGGEGHDTRAVRRHYAALARDYDDRANRACKRAYARLAARTLAGRRRVLELGAGASPLLPGLGPGLGVACDLSVAMLARRGEGLGVAADGQQLPFQDAAFDAAFCINVLEHVPDPGRLMAEAARVLEPGGRFLAVTPNGGAERLLDLLEVFHLKLPEGPHRFLTTRELAALADCGFRTLEHRLFLAFPAGPDAFVRAVDRAVAGRHGRGLFQYILLERQGDPAP